MKPLHSSAPTSDSTANLGEGSRPPKLWMAAIKPPMYSVAIMPIALGSAIAFYQTQTLRLGVLLVFFLSAILILAWENLSNDVFDAETGIDRHKLHSVVNLTGNKPLVFTLANLCLGAGLLGIVGIAWNQASVTVLGLILACCGLGYLYQGPPFRLGYRGLGEFLCFFAFGPLAVEAAYYSQAQTFSGVALAASVPLGLTTSLVLFCSHFHQVADDVAAGKRSPIVRLGTRRGAALLPWICGIALATVGLGILLGAFPLWTALAFASLPPAIQLCRHVQRYHDQPARVSNCKFIAIAFHFWSGVLLCLGFAIAPWLST